MTNPAKVETSAPKLGGEATSCSSIRVQTPTHEINREQTVRRKSTALTHIWFINAPIIYFAKSTIAFDRFVNEMRSSIFH